MPYLNTLAHPDEPHMQKYGRFGKLQFYELDQESKIWILKTHTLLTVWLCSQEHAKKRRKAVEGNADPTTRKRPPIKNLPRTAGVAGGGRKGPRTCRIPRVSQGGAGKALRQTNHRKGTMARRALVDLEGNTGANARENSCEKPPAGHRHGGGLDEETTNTRDGRWSHLQLSEGGKCLTEKHTVEQIQHTQKLKDDTHTRT